MSFLNLFLKSYVSDDESDYDFDVACHRMPIVEIESKNISQAVGVFLAKEGKTHEEGKLRIERVDARQEDGSKTVFTLGNGVFHVSFEGDEYVFTRTQSGDPVPGKTFDTEAVIYEHVTLEGETIEKIRNLCSRALDAQESDIDDFFQTYTWNPGNEFWNRSAFVPLRSLDTVVLEPHVLNDLKSDLDDFTSAETRSWYRKHCIPFRRGYLLHGPPGTGKTSTITAVATYLNRRVYRVSLVAPRLSDDSLHSAINTVSKNGIIVMEDIDALFDSHREKTDNFTVTFSGLLNAIDGVSDSSKGVIFIFTTNHPERLDPALCRKGRIDRVFKLDRVSHVTARAMFVRFYPESGDEDIEKFANSVLRSSPRPTPAELQHHFIMHRKDAADAATAFQTTNEPHLDKGFNTMNMWN